MPDEADVKDLQVLIAQRGRAKAALTRLKTFMESDDNVITFESCSSRLQKLESTFENYMFIHDQLLNNSLNPTLYVDDDDLVEFEQGYFGLKDWLNKKIREKFVTPKISQEPGPSTSSSSIDLNSFIQNQTLFFEKFSKTICNPKVDNLPRIKIPTFTGDIKHWKTFFDLFMSTYDSQPNLTSSQKFQNLKSCLSDEPLRLLDYLVVNDDNYVEAIDKLKQRYDRPPLIANAFVESFVGVAKLVQPSFSQLRKFYDTADSTIRGLRALGVVYESRDVWLVYILLQKLDPESKKEWAKYLQKERIDNPTVQQFLTFINEKCIELETLQHSTKSKSSFVKNVYSHPQSKQYNIKNFHVNQSKLTCVKCNANHCVYQCQQFIALDLASRRLFVKSKNLCYNCLRPNHNAANCLSKSTCKKCSKKHHTLVHPESTSTSSGTIGNSSIVQIESINDRSNENMAQISNYHTNQQTFMKTLLPTAWVLVKDSSENFQNCRVLLDSGSMSSFITEDCISRLGLKRSKAHFPVSGLGSTTAGFTKGVTTIHLSSRFDSQHIVLKPYILNNLTTTIPTFEFDYNNFHGKLPVNIADPHYYSKQKIDIIIGADRVFDKLLGDTFKLGFGCPTASLTIFGWVLAGEIQSLNEASENVCFSSFHTTVDTDFDLQQFWLIEDIETKQFMTNEELLTEKHFVEHYSRNEDGRYVVKLPFKNNDSHDFGNSLVIAENRLLSMEKRFVHNCTLKDQYSDFLKEYIDLDHMEEIPHHKLNLTESSKFCYLPHHAVFKHDSSTTKIRVVFDASAQLSNGESLNRHLLVGPKIQKDLFEICLKSRLHQFAFSADIEKMFRQILIHDDDQHFQRIVWRNDNSQDIKHYKLKTVTYGTASAPFLAVRTLKQLALENMKQNPIACNILLNDCYVDDVISGADKVEDVISIYEDLTKILASGGFNLRKWTSNCWPLLLHIPEHLKEYSPLSLDETSCIKLLGLQWHPVMDCFSYKVNLPNHIICTKRKILSDASRIFDPLGFLSPSVTLIKIMFQEIWLLNFDWDDVITNHIAENWELIRNQLSCFEQIRIPRKLFASSDNIEYHGFCDASEHAYSAVIYCVYHPTNAEAEVTIVAAKSKVSLLKQISIPRLELCGALLLSKLFNKISKSLQTENVYAWTDSKIVLAWLSAHPRRWKTYIGNRTAEILSNIPRDCWNHVISSENPADLNSRGVLPLLLKECDLWWYGPNWLKQNKENWPINNLNLSEMQKSSIAIEERPSKPLISHAIQISEPNCFENLIKNCSSWGKLYRTIAFCQRFINNCRINIEKRSTNCLTTVEINHAKNLCYRLAQHSTFAVEIQQLKSKKELSSKSQLLKLNIFLDENNILKVGGRIQKSTLPIKTKHPIVLHNSHPLTRIICRYYHQHYLHVGVSTLFFILKEEFFIIGARNLLKNIVFKCITCFRNRQSTHNQLMGNLPIERVTYSRPFSKVGVDYAGPIIIRSWRGRNPKFIKSYICLFICFSTKAFHIELTSDLSTSAFLAALDRFCSRRGKPSDIFSDNGTNFIGAKRVLNEMHTLLLSQKHNSIVADYLSGDGVNWHFNPPSSPHFGGLWESGVKMVKSHLKRVIGENKLTFEELYTLLTNIEGIINSRPLIAVFEDDEFALSPAHFLIGQQVTTIPKPDITNEKVSLLTNWKLLQNLTQHFWKHWHNDYLTSLQQRPKWFRQTTNLKVNDVVLIREPNLPPAKWVLGRIVECFPGEDDKVRVCSVKTSKGIYKRPIVKLIPVPVAEDP